MYVTSFGSRPCFSSAWALVRAEGEPGEVYEIHGTRENFTWKAAA